MPRSFTFLCGCKTGEIVSPENLLTMDSLTTDENGYIICAIHHEHERGFFSPSKIIERGEPGNIEYYLVPDHKEWAKRVGLSKDKTDWVPVRGVDRRDNRDPETVGKELLAKRNGSIQI